MQEVVYIFIQLIIQYIVHCQTIDLSQLAMLSISEDKGRS